MQSLQVVEVVEPVLAGANYDGVADDDDQTAEMSLEDEERGGEILNLPSKEDERPKDNTPCSTMEMVSKSRSVQGTATEESQSVAIELLLSQDNEATSNDFTTATRQEKN